MQGDRFDPWSRNWDPTCQAAIIIIIKFKKTGCCDPRGFERDLCVCAHLCPTPVTPQTVARLLYPWNFPGKNIEIFYWKNTDFFFFFNWKYLRIFQVRRKWVAISFSRGSSWPRDSASRVSCVSCIAGGFSTCWTIERDTARVGAPGWGCGIQTFSLSPSWASKYFFSSTAPHNMWDLTSPTRDQAHTPYSGSAEY